MNNDLFYDTLSVEELDMYAKKTFGDGVPSDLQMFLKYIPEQAHILEVGAGTGRIGSALLSKGYSYIGAEKQKKFADCFPNSEKHVYVGSFVDLLSPNEFSVILFSWTVIGDFSATQQESIFLQVYESLKDGGICLLDNPSKNQAYNSLRSYTPTPFHFDDWSVWLESHGFVVESVNYTTQTGVQRELTILRK